MLLRNKGADWRRPSGQGIVKKGETFTPTEKELRGIIQRNQMPTLFEEVVATSETEKVGGEDSTGEQDAAPQGASTAAGSTSTAPEGDPGTEPEGATGQTSGSDKPAAWTLKLSPAKYLERFPDGPAAALARTHVALDKAAGA